MGKPSGGRVGELDAIRAFAAISVLLYHLGVSTGWAPVDAWLRRGWLAVDLFFLLSGYLITSILLAHPVDRGFLGSFYARRGLRIWPLYYLAIALVFALSHSGLMPATWPPFTRRLALHYLTFTQAVPSYWGDHTAYYHSIGHFWSLAVEEQFYLFWPFWIYLAGRRGVVPLALVFIVASAVYREVPGTSRHLLLVRSDGLAYGAILAVIASREGFEGRRAGFAAGFALVAAASMALLAASALAISRSLTHSDSLLIFANPFCFGVVGVVVCCAGRPWLTPLRARWLCYLGQISYGLYLYHCIVYAIIDHCLGDGQVSPRHPALKLGVTLAISVVSWEIFEKPILALKDRFPYEAKGRRVAEPPN